MSLYAAMSVVLLCDPVACAEMISRDRIDGQTEVMTVTLHDLSGTTRYRVALPPDGN